MEFIVEHAHHFRLKSVKRLDMSGAYHTPLMMPAVEPLKHALQRLAISRTPCLPVVSNVDAEPYGKASSIPLRLAKQVCASEFHPIVDVLRFQLY